jgi:hypothetical protein
VVFGFSVCDIWLVPRVADQARIGAGTADAGRSHPGSCRNRV